MAILLYSGTQLHMVDMSSGDHRSEGVPPHLF